MTCSCSRAAIVSLATYDYTLAVDVGPIEPPAARMTTPQFCERESRMFLLLQRDAASKSIRGCSSVFLAMSLAVGKRCLLHVWMAPSCLRIERSGEPFCRNRRRAFLWLNQLETGSVDGAT